MSGCSRCSLRGWNSCADVSFHNLKCRLAGLSKVPRYECNGTPAQQWFIKSGSTKVQLAGTNFCLDAGTSEYGVDLVHTRSNCPLQLRPMVSSSRSGHATTTYPLNNGFIPMTIVSRWKTKVIFFFTSSTMFVTIIYRVLHGFREWDYDEWQQGADLAVYRQ